jgi:transcriptional regulator with GAF, ATPase, and Fis domain
MRPGAPDRERVLYDAFLTRDDRKAVDDQVLGVMHPTPVHFLEVALARLLAGEHSKEQYEEIVRVLIERKGPVGGPEGAAARMGISRTTLISRMKRPGIDPYSSVRLKSRRSL